MIPATELRLQLNTDQCLAVADGIRHGRCNVQRLTLDIHRGIISDATEVVKAIASAIRLDHSLEYVELKMRTVSQMKRAWRWQRH
jgi:hypothetical protein